MSNLAKIRIVLTSLLGTTVLALVFVIYLLVDQEKKLKENTVSIKEYKLLKQELELVRRDAGIIQYKLYLTEKENKRLIEKNKSCSKCKDE